MLQSMTGFGRSKEQAEGYLINVEIKSLNSKFLDAQVRLPKQFMDKELEVRTLVTSKLVRGKVSLNIELTSQSGVLEGQQVNQCDGCRQGLPTTAGIHHTEGRPFMLCTKDRYVNVEAWRTDGQGIWYGVNQLASTGGLGVPVTDFVEIPAQHEHEG